MKRRIKFIILSFIIICSIYLINETNSRYLSKVNMNGNINVAVPQIAIDTSNYLNSISILPGETQSFDFSIKNYKDSKINEVLMEYYININIIKSDIPLTYKVYQISGSNENELNYTTEGFGPITLNYETQEEKHYKIVFAWDENDNNISYTNKEYTFQILAKTMEIYEQTITSEEIAVKGQEYSNLTATIAAVSTLADVENAFDVTVINSNPYDAEQVQIATGQIVYLEKSIKNNIIAEAGEVESYEEGFTFTGTSSSSDAALCSIEDPVSGETMYFYRGAVSNNYVSFAGYTWRILRINSDGSLRLILDDIATTCQYQSSNTPTENTIASAITLLDWRNSTPYSALHTWYDTNIAPNYGDKVVESQFVFDASYDESTSSSAGACYYFGPYLRVGSDANLFAPTFSYTEDSLITDTIGLITADELLYAGAYFRSSNTSFFLNNSSITTPCWTMSPSFWDNSAHYKAGMMILDSDGRMHDWPDGGNTLTATLGLRPVISIRGDIEMDGSGTASDPYKYID